MKRDFTFIDDIVKPFLNVPLNIQNQIRILTTLIGSFNSFAPHKIFNISNSSPINLLRFIAILENSLGLKAEKIYKPLQKET